MKTKRSEMLCIKVSELYNNSDIYRYMPRTIFNLLESSYLAGDVNAMVPEAAHIHILHLRTHSRDESKIGTGYKFIDIDVLGYLLAEYKISADWLLTGRGGMFHK